MNDSMTVIPTAALPQDIRDAETAARIADDIASGRTPDITQKEAAELAARLRLHALRLEGK